MSKRTVYVNGYYRANGTYVSGYTRTVSSSSRSRGSSSGERTVQVSGYTKANGTYVAPYTRSAPRSSSGSYSSGSSSGEGTVQVSGYTKANGTYVAPYTRSAPRSSSGSCSRGSSSGEGTVQVSGYTKANGTYVAPYTRSAPRSSTDASSRGSSSGQRCYVDNAYNRKLGRVGKPLGTHVVHSARVSVPRERYTTLPTVQTTDALGAQENPKPPRQQKPAQDSTHVAHRKGVCVPGERYYADNAHNRRLGRARKPIPRRLARQKELAESSTVADLAQVLQGLGFTDACRPAYQSALDRLEREQVEERWRKDGVNPSTDLSELKGLSPGKIIPFAELQQERVIGRGGFGEVYACLWRSQAVAFKKLFYQRMSKKRRDSFVTEITVLAALDHPNTVKMVGVVVEEGKIGIVMEYLPRSLFQAIFIDHAEFPDAKKKEIIHQMASALVYLHTHEPKIAHCDVKSENVLLDGNDKAKLGDFGLSAIKNATESSRSTAAGVAPGQGTPRYSAPEVLRGEILTMSQLFQADIYSLAVVAFEVVAEEEPFEGLSVKQLESNVGRGDLRPTSSVALSPKLSDLLKRSWEGTAQKRPGAAEFIRKLHDICDLYR